MRWCVGAVNTQVLMQSVRESAEAEANVGKLKLEADQNRVRLCRKELWEDNARNRQELFDAHKATNDERTKPCA